MLALTVVLCFLVLKFVDLRPQVGQNFFFSSDDPSFQEDADIDRMFPSGSQLIVSVASPDISSNSYLERLERLTQRIQSVEGVSSVDGLTDGPKNFEDAEKSPFWKRLLIAENGRSSNVVVFMPAGDSQQPIHRIEAIVSEFDAKDFRTQIAGAPYVADMIQRSLNHDFHVFSLTSVLLFGIAMGVLFRSVKLTLGMLATCISADLITLLLQAAFGQKIGILTANLVTIVFVITLSHLVYMTFNWQTLANKQQRDTRDIGAKAWRMTLPASFWSMVCALLGFGSLLIVPAKPLRSLGVGGTVGTVVAFAAAYLIYPAFLGWAEPKHKGKTTKKSATSFWQRKFVWVSLMTVSACAALGFGITRLNTDPSLLDYFKKGMQPREGLSYVDRNGGSNPLTLVVAAADGGRLDTKEEYQNMWDLQDALENYQSTGTVLSSPILMDEAHHHPFAFLLSWNHLLSILNEPKYDRVASTFVTKDRTRAAFYLRMVEQKRQKDRVNVVNDL